MVHPGRGAKVTTKLAAFRRVGVMMVRELALTALLLLGVSLVVFVILHLSPGDPFSVLLEGQAPGQAVSTSAREALGSLLVTLLLAVPVALYSASRGTGVLARALTLAVYLISAVPVFWLGYVVIYLFIHRFGLFPLLSATAGP